jgi:hypothetical protein
MMGDLFRALEGHPTLQNLSIGADNVRHLLPVVRSIPTLTKVTFRPACLTTTGARHIAELLRTDAPLLVEFLSSLEFTDMSAYTLFCTGLAQAMVRSFALLGRFEVSDGALLADALTSSSLRAISCPQLIFRERRELKMFFTTFAAGTPSLRNLEELHVGTIGHFGHDKDELSALEAALIRATADCPCLKLLKIDLYQHTCSYTESMDRALAHCVQASTSLEELYLYRQCEANVNEVLTCPALLKALKRNYTIQCIRLTSEPFWETQCSWDAASTTTISMLCRLNRSGRRYVQVDSSNRFRGLQVLEAVNDDLDCLYYHLRENPLLCEQSSIV